MFQKTFQLSIPGIVFLFLCVLTLIAGETFMITRLKNGNVFKTDLTKPNAESVQTFFPTPENDKFQIIKRSQWLSVDPEVLPPRLVTPVHHVMFMSTETDLCTTTTMCTWQVLIIQSRNLAELLPYNFMIGGDGQVYEGRGWDYRGQHPTNGYKIEDTISVAYLGTNAQKEPTKKQIAVAQLLLSEGVRLNKLTADYNVHAVFNVKPGNILPQASTVICEHMQSNKHQCTELYGNNEQHN